MVKYEKAENKHKIYALKHLLIIEQQKKLIKSIKRRKNEGIYNKS